MVASIESKAQAKATLDKLKKNATVTEQEIKQLQQHIEVLEKALANEEEHIHEHHTAM